MALRIGALLLIALLSAAALLFLLPGLKEGFDRSDASLLITGVVVLLAAAGAWFRFSRGAARAFGLLMLVFPLFAYASVGVQMAYSAWQGPRLARQSTIGNLRVTPIVWPGFDGPVGLHLELDLEHPLVRDGNLLPPKLVWSAHPLPPAEYFSLYDAEFLAWPVFQPDPHSSGFREPSPSHLAYDLYPSRVRRLSAEMSPCVDPSIGRAAPLAAGGGLTASWYFAGPHQLEVDLGPALTAALGETRVTPEEWTAMFRRFDDPALRAAGYHPCTEAGCYCR